MRIKFYIFIFLLFTGFGSLFAQSFQWIKRGGSNENLGGDHESVYSMASDSERNYYVLSYVGMSDLDVADNPKSNYDSPTAPQDVVLASFSCDGTYRWSKVIGGIGDEYINSVVVDSQDNVYIAGTVGGCHPYPGTPSQPYSSRIDSDYFFNNSSSSCSLIFFAKFNKNGVLQYVKRPQLPNNLPLIYTRSWNFEMQNDFIYWYVWLPAGTYADGGLTNTNTTDPSTPYVLKYNLDGTFVSATQLGTLQTYSSFTINYYRNPYNGYYYATIIKVDPDSIFTINGQPIVNYAALVCYDNNGTFLWKRENTYNDAGTINFNDLAFDSQNNIYLAAYIFGLNMDSFLGFSTASVGAGFLMKINPSGTSALWVSYPTSGGAMPISIYNNGVEIAITGVTGGGPNLVWGSQTLTVPGANQGTDVMFARINSNTGACLSVHKIVSSDASEDYGEALIKDAAGDYVVGGRFMGGLYDVNSNATWNGGGDSDFFIAKFASQVCSPLSADSFEGETFSVYPNPVQDVCTVDVKESTSYRVYTLSGVLVKEGNLTASSTSIVMRDLTSGFYVLRLESINGQVTILKILKA